MTEATGLTRDIPIVRICGQRDLAIATMEEAADLIERGHALADEAHKIARGASGGASFHLVDRTKDSAFKHLFRPFNSEGSKAVFRSHTDACIWVHLFRVTGMETLMDTTAREEWFSQLSEEVAPVSEDNIYLTLQGLRDDATLIFQRGLARAFSDLDKRFKSHDAFKIGSRMILSRCFDSWGSWDYHSKGRTTLSDIERVFAVLAKEKPDPGELERLIRESRQGSYGPRQGVCESRYFRIRTFKNGNAHLWFTRDDLVLKANLLLAEYYGEVLPDGVPRDDDELRTTSGLPSKNLSFYASQAPVVKELVKGLWLEEGARVLEPSAGTGSIAEVLVALPKVSRVDAIEIDSERVKALSRIGGLNVYPGNFLQMTARPVYNAVVMNPPFYGTHWMEHVLHAFDFLAPGGTLRAVLPATAEVGDSKKHRTFRAWAAKHSNCGQLRFKDLPAESFAASGTRVSTVILELLQRGH